MKKIDVSVIIPIYNGALLIDRCLNSVFAQQTHYTMEVIVIDDGSTDNSVELIKSRKEKNIFIVQQKNAGPAAARNKGIDAATANYIAFIDADDYWMPLFIEETVNFLENNPEAIAVNTAQIHKLSGKNDAIMPQYLKGINCNELKPIIISDFFSFWAKHKHVCTGSVLLRTNIVKMSGGQRIDLKVTEDLEFWAYLCLFGQWGFIPTVLFVSDGSVLTKNIGWLNKMKQRWNNAPTVENWEIRIKQKIKEPLSSGYLKMRGMIALNLCYCQLLSGRVDLSKREILKYNKYFPDDKISKLLKFGVKYNFLWRIITRILIYREYHR